MPHVPALRPCWTANFFLNGTLVTILFCDPVFSAVQSPSEDILYTLFMADLNQKEIIFFVIHFFFPHVKTTKLQPTRQCWSVLHREGLMAWTRQNSISSLSVHKVLSEGIVKSSNCTSGKAGFCFLVTKLGVKEVVLKDQPLEGFTIYNRHCNLLTLLDDSSARRKHIFRARCLSNDSFKVS